MYYPKSTWKLGAERVVHGPEEHYQAKVEGWGDEKDPDTEPRGSALHEIAEDIKAGTFPRSRHEPNAVTIAAFVESDESYEASEALLNAPKRRGRPPKIQSIQGVA